MPRYGMNGEAANGTTLTLTSIHANATTPRPIALYDVVVSSDAAVADQSVEINVNGVTDAGSGGTTNTVLALNANSPASTGSAKQGTYTTAPTIGRQGLVEFALNLRASFRWVAAPEGELVCATTASHGFSVQSIASTAAYNNNVTMHWIE